MNRSLIASRIVQDEMSELEASILVMWFIHRVEKCGQITPAEIADFFFKHAISQPNRSRLQAKLAKDPRILYDRRAGTIRLRAAAMYGFDSANDVTADYAKPAMPLIASLELQVAKVRGDQTVSFLNEAIKCVRNGTPRAAIIMTWCGAVSVLQEYVFDNSLAEFNVDAVKNGLLKSPVRTLADLRDISKESLFLESLARISIIDSSIKKALKRCLDRRNEVGHPSEVRLSDAAVADHIETLVLNVFDKFAKA